MARFYRANLLASVVKLAQRVENHLAGILAYWKWGVTHAFMEGINRVFSATQRKARGYRSTTHLITMLYFGFIREVSGGAGRLAGGASVCFILPSGCGKAPSMSAPNSLKARSSFIGPLPPSCGGVRLAKGGRLSARASASAVFGPCPGGSNRGGW